MYNVDVYPAQQSDITAIFNLQTLRKLKWRHDSHVSPDYIVALERKLGKRFVCDFDIDVVW